MPLLVPSRSTFGSADETAIVQYHGAYGIGPAAVTPAAVGLDRETAPSAASAATNAATNAAATMRGRVTMLVTTRAPGRRRDRSDESPRSGSSNPSAPVRPQAPAPTRTRRRRRSSGGPPADPARAAP